MTSDEVIAMYEVTPPPFFRGAAKPYVRWWWLAGPFRKEDIEGQLRWVLQMGFGGVELAWIYPSWVDPDLGSRPEWLGAEWAELVGFAKRTADSLGLGCDFTFGSCWPFGGSWVTAEDAAQTFSGLSWQKLGCSWEQPAKEASPVLNHLSAAALERYARPLLHALRPALEGGMSALFCDSLELETEAMWSRELWGVFEARFGYSLQPFVAELDKNAQVRYDYRKLIADTIRREFYETFTGICRDNGGYARVQCHGAPTDLLAAYAAVDVPESEALLFAPRFSRIAASAAAWAGKRIVSAEAFTCIYGFPGWDDAAETYWRDEKLADLKLLADSLFANGVNQIVWHGMPYQPDGKEVEFYASVHVGPDSAWVAELPAFNQYLEDISALMRMGQAYGAVGVYLPFEDALMQDRLADEERTPGANFHWEMRHAVPPNELEGFHPLWISEAFLRVARVENGAICSGELQLKALYVDCEWLDAEALYELLRLAEEGARVVYAQPTKQPGWQRDDAEYQRCMERLRSLSERLGDLELAPLLRGERLPLYWARSLGQKLLLFVAHPLAKDIHYPMEHGMGLRAGEEERDVLLTWRGRELRLKLQFQPSASLALLIDEQGSVEHIQTKNNRPAQ